MAASKTATGNGEQEGQKFNFSVSYESYLDNKVKQLKDNTCHKNSER